MESPLITRRRGALPIYYFPALAHSLPRHGISTRHGGVSQGPFRSLNLSRAGGDDPAAVGENLRRWAAALGLETRQLVQLRQVHGRTVLRVGREQAGQLAGEADGLVTDQPGVGLLLRFADCVPLIACDPGRGVAGCAHAGWQGTVAGVAQSLVQAFQRHFGSRPGDLRVAMGPSVGPCHYPVGSEVEAAARRAYPQLAPRWFTPDHRFDLWRANGDLLRRAGVAHLQLAALCTACHPDEFFSLRAAGWPTGHFACLVALD